MPLLGRRIRRGGQKEVKSAVRFASGDSISQFCGSENKSIAAPYPNHFGHCCTALLQEVADACCRAGIAELGRTAEI